MIILRTLVHGVISHAGVRFAEWRRPIRDMLRTPEAQRGAI